MVFETKPVMASFISGGRAREESAGAGDWPRVSYRSCCLIVFAEEVAEVAGSGWTWGFEERWGIGERGSDTARGAGRHCRLLLETGGGLPLAVSGREFNWVDFFSSFSCSVCSAEEAVVGLNQSWVSRERQVSSVCRGGAC